MKIVILAAMSLLGVSLAQAQSDVLIEIDRGRTEGLFVKSPVYQRAILSRPDKATDTAVLFFRGYPGIARIEAVEDKKRNLIPFLRMNQKLFNEEGLALVVVDCPTDQWGAPGTPPTACLDDYRSSPQHADDVRSVMKRLKEEYGLSKIYIMGHSFGSISSRWLARQLGNEIAGSIHSASMNGVNAKGYGNSLAGFPYEALAAPVLHVHNENDACRTTPYGKVKEYAGKNLVTIRGGEPEGDPCGATHLHSYKGREEQVVRAIISWIKTRKIEQ
jgi:hypothetical protein